MSMRKLFLAAALTFAASLPAAAQIGSPVDPNGSYVGPFGPVASGGIDRFAQTFQRASGFNWLQGFTFYLGDWNPDASGTGLVFQAAVYSVNGNALGSQLYLSGLQFGSGNYSGFDTYTFSTPNLFLDPTVDTYALVLQSVSNTNNALNVIAAGATDYTGGALYSVDGTGNLAPAIDGTADAAFDATVTPSAVPEPATIVLMATGFGFVGVIARRRRRV